VNGATTVKKIGFTNYYTATVQLAAILVLLYISSLYSYLLFHTVVEMAGIIIAGIIFLVVWNGRRYIDNGYFIFLGIALIFVAGISLFHLLSYKGMGVLPDNGSNAPTQLWIAGRYLAAASFLLAPLFIRKKIDVPLMFIFYSAAFLLIILSIFYWKNFPPAFIEGSGLTAFKKDSEYIIAFMFGISGLLVYRLGKYFNRRVKNLIIFSLVLSIITELFFTEYVTVYGPANLIGHLFLIASYYFLYLGIIEVALRRPSHNLYRNLMVSRETLKNSETSLKKMNDLLEEKVRIRTYDLQKTNEQLNARNLLLKLASETKSRKAYLYEVMNLIKDWTGCKYIGIRVVNDSGSVPFNVYSGYSKKFWDAENWLSLKKDECVCTRVARGIPCPQDLKFMSENGSFLCQDTLKYIARLPEDDINSFRGECVKQGFLTLAVIPIFYGRDILGVIHIADKEKNKLIRKEINFLESLAPLIGNSISKFNMLESLDKSKRALAVLSEGNHILVHAKSEKELIDGVCEMIVKKGGYVAAWIGYLNRTNKNRLEPVAQYGVTRESLNDIINVVRAQATAKGSAKLAVESGETQVRRNIQVDPNYEYFKEPAVKLQFKSSISLPLKSSQHLFGALNIYAKESVAFDKREIKLLEELASDMAYGINTIRTRVAKERSERQLVKSYQHLGLINRKISVLLDLGKNYKDKKNLGNYILKTAISLSQADLGLLYKYDSKGNFALLSSRGVGKKIDEEIKFFNSESHKFLKPVVERQKKLEVRPEMYDLGCFNINDRVRCYLIIPLSKMKSGRLKGAIFLGYLDEKKLYEQELEFYDVFERHASAALFNAKVL